MHLRSTAGVPQHCCDETLPDIMLTLPSNTQPTVKGAAVTKKMLLWLLLLVQIVFIGCFWLLNGSGVSDEPLYPATLSAVSTGESTVAATNIASGQHMSSAVIAANRVNFITKAVAVSSEKNYHNKQWLFRGKPKRVESYQVANHFARDFFLKPKARLNRTLLDNDDEAGNGLAAAMEPLEYEYATMPPLWCFRAGTLNESSVEQRRSALTVEDSLLDPTYEQCNCQPGWHGRDCGQPEIMWRGLMAAKRTFPHLQPHENEPHRLIYMLEGNFVSLDMLELQIQAVAKAVDIFFIYVRNIKDHSALRALRRRVGETLSASNYYILHCSAMDKWKNCTTAQMYAQFRKQLQLQLQLKPTDLLLYSDDCAIISPQALTYLRYYAAEMPLMHFRLKYTLYGFYWQHPQHTHLTGIISSLAQLDEPQLGIADPAQLMRRMQTMQSDALVIGDLNHYGGWYCKYCEQPEEIIAELQLHAAETEYSSSLHQVHFPNVTRNRHIDATYMQSLIANGISVDGKTKLTRLRSQTDKYYAPPYAQENSWKFGHLLVNIYESLDDVSAEEEELY